MMQTRRHGGANLGLLMLFFAAALSWGGGQGVYTAVSNSEPTSVTMEEYAESQPDAKWLELRDAYVNVLQGAHMYKVYADSMAPTSTIYLPVFASREESMGTPRVILETSDPELTGIYNTMTAVPEEEFDSWMEENWERVESVRTVRGLVSFGIDLESKTQDLLRGAYDAEEFILIVDGEQPAMGSSLFLLLIGIGLLFLGLRQFRGRGAPADEELAQEPVAAGA